jgi:hypothetical protein
MAPLVVTLTLLLETAMGVGLLAGALLARFRRFRAHAWCQSVIVLVNCAVIALWMIPSFRLQVLPKIPLKLGKAHYALATAHAALGTVTELAGLYILLAAGTKLLPAGCRIARYKLWMRAVLVLWWVVLALGWATYVRWYVPSESRRTSAGRYDDTGIVPWITDTRITVSPTRSSSSCPNLRRSTRAPFRSVPFVLARSQT